MSRKIGRFLSLACACTAGIVFCLAACVTAVFVIHFLAGEISTGLFCTLLFASLTIMLFMLGIIGIFNRFFDGDIHHARIGRWAKTAVFAALSAVFLTLLSMKLSQSPLSVFRQQYVLIISVCALTAAAVIYIHNYHRLRPRRDQINAVMKHNTLQSRRFVFLVQETDSSGILRGMVHGEMRQGDRVYILTSGKAPVKSFVSCLYAEGKELKKAADRKVEIRVPYPKEPDHVYAKYTVITDILPAASAEYRISVENPRVTGMIAGYPELYGDQKFMSELIYDFVHASYLVPAKIMSSIGSPDITEPLSGSHEVSFLSVSTSARPDAPVFPVFTDWDAFGNYKEIMEDEHAVSLIMTFQQASKMLKKGYQGLVINPFGPGSFYLSQPFIESIENLDAYQEEFLSKQESRNKKIEM